MSDSINMGKGFSQVDDQAEPERFVTGMDQTGQWPAVKRLRAWERDRLKVAPGDHVLDVGCGTADVLIELAATVGADGRAVGVDASENMLAAGRQRAEALGVAVDLSVGDAEALTFGDASFSVTRSERTLQWLAHPEKAVAEIVRVTRPGGRICLTDTDWRTLAIDHPSPDLVRKFLDAMSAVRGDGLAAGGRLMNLLRSAGVERLEVTAETHMWTSWNPDEMPSPPGMVPLGMVAKDLVAKGLIDAGEAEQMVQEWEQSARDDRLFASLTMISVAGVAPRP